ncbi:hypothetical protein M0805_005074 [Coniferiporia weirii]|nr:hypothetical protein M0805_005074 [Coniferiporia weirii]
MAFSNYSNLFKCGLLSEGSSPSYASAPWATEYYGPRRGSLPGSVDDLTVPPPPPSSSSGRETNESIASGESFYFTFKKRRNSTEHRSFLSLDLAESLRSASLRRKNSVSLLVHRPQQSGAYTISPAPHSSFVPMFSPPPPSSPPQSPLSSRSVPDRERPNPFGLPLSPGGSRRSASFAQSSPTQLADYKFPPHPPLPRRELSPMRFAAPSPPPLPPTRSMYDAASAGSLRSFDILSRSSTISSGYRRAQRVDALKRLEGRGADGAIGRIKPRLSQNFMSMSDDEDEDGDMSLLAGINVIVEDTTKNDATPRTKRSSRASKGRELSVSIYGRALYGLTPQASAWGALFGAEEGGDVDTGIDEMFGLKTATPSRSDDPNASDGSRKSKRSKHFNAPLPTLQRSALPLRRASAQPPAHIHPLSPSFSTSSSSPSIASFKLLPDLPKLALSTPNHRGVRTRTVSDYGGSLSSFRSRPIDTQVRPRKSHQPRTPPRVELRLGWASEEPSFIDMRDEGPDTDSHSDSVHSLIEVFCAA